MGDYLKLSIVIEPTNPWGDLLAQDLGHLGFESFETVDTGLLAYIPKEHFDADQYDVTVKGYSDRAKISTNIEEVKKENWNLDWETNYDAIEIENEISVRADFHEPNPTCRYEIVITPKMSFGTGHHETTKLMLTEMLGLDLVEAHVLDVGCGTGILSIFARIKGATKVYAIDNDDWAVENARENVGINNFKDIVVDKAELDDVDENLYNVILANINYNVILSDLHKYNQRLEVGGELLLSGFLQTQKKDLIAIAENLNLAYINEMNQGEWCMLHLGKK